MRRTCLALALASVGLGACDCPPADVVPGSYGADQIAELHVLDYRLKISSDKSEVVETFTKDGRRFTVRYRVLRQH
jgi:hypothetical protein